MDKDYKNLTIEELREVGRKLKGKTLPEIAKDPELREAWAIRNSYLRDWGILPSNNS